MSKHLNRERLKLWIEGELSDSESAVVESHVETCDECAELIANVETKDDPFVERVRDVLDADSTLTNSSPTLASLTTDEKIGAMIGPYKLLQLLGEGGMGSVWMAQQDKPVRRNVALKIIKAGMDTKEVIARFETERQSLAMMDHPNIAQVLDAGTTETGRPYFVMTLVKGIPITDFCDQNKISPERRLELFCDICNAIQHAHRKGIIHRDIKPTNILVTLENTAPAVKVIDFGLAKATGVRLTEQTMFTALGQMVGTPSYMSPEQAESGALDVDTRTDVYSLGVLLYELLTGVTPLDVARLQNAGHAELQRIIRTENPVTPSTRLSSADGDSSVVAEKRSMEPRNLVQMLRGDLDVIVMKALEKDRGRRYDSPKDFSDDILRYLRHEPIEARPPSFGYRLKRLYDRNTAAFVSGMLIAVSLLVGIITSTTLAIRARRAERTANDRLIEVNSEQKKTAAALNAVELQQAKTKAALLAVEQQQRKTEAALAASELAREETEEVSRLLLNVLRSPDPTQKDATLTVRELLDRAVKRLEEFSNQPERKIRLKEAIADTYESLGLFDRVLPLRKHIDHYWTAERGADDRKSIVARIALANAFTKVGQKSRSSALNRELLETVTRVFGREHSLTVTVTNNLANTVSDQNERLRLREENVELARQLLGEEDQHTLLYMDNLAISYHTANRWADAIALREEVLNLRKKVLGLTHPDTLFTVRGLLLYYRKAKLIEKELPLAETNLKVSRDVFGPDHHYTMTAMGRVAGALEQVDEVERALALRSQVLNAKRRRFGINSNEALFTEKTLLQKYGTFARFEECRELGAAMIKRLEAEFGKHDKRTKAAMNSFAFALCSRPGADEESLAIAHDLARDICGSSSEIATYWNTLAQVEYRLGNWDAASTAVEKSIALHGKGGAIEDRFLQAMIQWQLGQKDESIKLLEAASEWYADHPTGNKWLDMLEQEATQLINQE